MAARNCYSKYSTDPAFTGPKIVTPPNNYLSGNGKSEVYQGAGWYVPSERRWQRYHEYTALPSSSRRDAIDFQSEDDFVQFRQARDRPRAPMLTSYIPGEKPADLKLTGYRREDSVVPEHSQFSTYERFPRWQGSGYYGYYHEALDLHDGGRMKTLPRYPGYPLVSSVTGI
ncbi:hypothetical protein BOX15_Mlig032686g1 [Macrostomum lignano]|uniref:Uncharacterized protein n=1 Tax=Macrostomum lignano TaxID=282301 RepID=A0A267FNG8_9PLAT|nr:hypothetical protein BOX15_Mlig032686g1 [Macrostomum lignano]